jgi:predicted ATPase
MLREMAEAVEVVTAERLLMLVLEDLHWSDHATLEWLAYVARRRDRARLLILATYRPVEVIGHGRPLRTMLTELRRHDQCNEQALSYLSETEVTAYLRHRFGSAQAMPSALTQALHQRTNGNPLFLVSVADDLDLQTALANGGEAGGMDAGASTVAQTLPSNLKQLIEDDVEQLDPDAQALLEAASVAGRTFAIASVAAGAAQADDLIETQCATWARQGRFIETADQETWQDGTVTACYRFVHDLYHEVIYGQVSAGRRVRLHRQIGMRKEVGYAAQAWERAAELAMHFAQGQDGERAVQYSYIAADNAMQRHAYHEAITHLTQGLSWLTTLPETPDRLQQELDFHIKLGAALRITKGNAAAEVERAYARARELCRQLENATQLLPVLVGLILYYQGREQLQTAYQLAEQLLHLTHTQHEPALLIVAHYFLGMVLFLLGEPALAQTHHTQGLATYTPQEQRALELRFDLDFGVTSLSHLACEVWQLGYPDQAMQHSQAALTLAQEVAHPYCQALALAWAAVFHQFRRDTPEAHERAVAAINLGTEQGFALWVARGTVIHGWALAAQGQIAQGMAEMRQGLDAELATGATLWQLYYQGLLAAAYGESGQLDEARRLLGEALAVMDTTEVRFFSAELLRLQGVLLLKQATPDAPQAEIFFCQAISVARTQQAKSWELRATTSLAHLWQSQGKRQEAYELLQPVYEWFTEGFDTVDLKEAKGLLDQLE